MIRNKKLEKIISLLNTAHTPDFRNAEVEGGRIKLKGFDGTFAAMQRVSAFFGGTSDINIGKDEYYSGCETCGGWEESYLSVFENTNDLDAVIEFLSEAK